MVFTLEISVVLNKDIYMNQEEILVRMVVHLVQYLLLVLQIMVGMVYMHYNIYIYINE